MSEFKREGRYIVVKPDCEDSLRTERLRNYIDEMCFHTPDCVVIEADWPEYEPVWKMIEDRVTGKQPEFVSSEVLCEHSGCGHGPQSNQLSFTIYRGDKLVMHRGKLGDVYSNTKVKP